MTTTNDTIDKRKINVIEVDELESKQKKIRVSDKSREALEEKVRRKNSSEVKIL